MVEIIRPPADEQTIAGLLVNSLGLAGALAVAAVPLGLVVGYFLIRWNARRPPEAAHMPHVSPSLQLSDDPDPPSDRVR
jgi:ABC-type phosphate transport system permease subunit